MSSQNCTLEFLGSGISCQEATTHIAIADKWLACKSVGLHKPVNFPSQKCMGINMLTDLEVFFNSNLDMKYKI